jgi:hypothetical protein
MYKRYDQSDLRPFQSMYKEGHVTVDNYIAEMLFKRRAEFSGKALPQSFWNNPKFRQAYIIELTRINKLLERVCSSCIIKAFNQTKACSVKNPDLIRLAEKFQQEMEDKKKVIEKTEEKPAVGPTKPFGKVNKLSEL